jgi:hypothetical protein
MLTSSKNIFQFLIILVFFNYVITFPSFLFQTNNVTNQKNKEDNVDSKQAKGK